MFQYIIRRLLLMIPTFLGITFMVFFILQVAPDGPFERAVAQLKSANATSESGVSMSSDLIGNSSELSPDILEDLRMQYGLDKPIIIRYMIWLGVFPKEYKRETAVIGKHFRETIDFVQINENSKKQLQKYILVESEVNNNNISYNIIESGAGLKYSLPDVSKLQTDENFDFDKYIFFQNEYQELPRHELISTWYFSDWDLEKVNSDNTVTLVKKEFNGIFQGFLGYSEKKGKNVSTLIAERMHISIFFGFTSLILVYLICIPLGILKALKHGKRFDVLSSIIVFTGYSIPGYALGVLLLSYLGGDIFPLHGWRSPDFSELSLWGKIKDQIHHAFLPIVCYMVGSFATMTVLMKNSLMENLNQDYVRTAFAKGLSEKRVIFFHAVRNSLIPLATGIGSSIGIFLAGSYLIEKTFGIDGIGLLGFNALIDKDYSIMMGALAIQVVILLIGNLISDITYAIIDPRIRFK